MAGSSEAPARARFAVSPMAETVGALAHLTRTGADPASVTPAQRVLRGHAYGPSRPVGRRRAHGAPAGSPTSWRYRRPTPVREEGARTWQDMVLVVPWRDPGVRAPLARGEEHTAETQAPPQLGCRLLL